MKEVAVRIVLKLTGIPLHKIQERTRKREIVTARILLTHLLIYDVSVSDISRLLYPRNFNGNRATVYHMDRQHKSLYKTNPIYQQLTKHAEHLYGEVYPAHTSTEPERLS